MPSRTRLLSEPWTMMHSPEDPNPFLLLDLSYLCICLFSSFTLLTSTCTGWLKGLLTPKLRSVPNQSGVGKCREKICSRPSPRQCVRRGYVVAQCFAATEESGVSLLLVLTSTRPTKIVLFKLARVLVNTSLSVVMRTMMCLRCRTGCLRETSIPLLHRLLRGWRPHRGWHATV